MEDVATRQPPLSGLEPDGAALRSYRFAAAVLSSFRTDALRPLNKEHAADDDAVLDLLELCERVTAARDDARWMLKNSVRRETLKEMGSRAAIKRALRANKPHPDDPLQRMFEAYVAGSAAPVEKQTTEELTASLQVRDWLADVVQDLPDRQHLIDRLEWQQLLQPFRDLVGEHFRGREKELADLQAFFQESATQRSIYKSESRPLMVFGPGGVGKSTLLARFILDTVQREAGASFAFCYWDMDRATLVPEEPMTLLAELVQQLGLQFLPIKEQAQALRQRWLGRLAASAGTRQPLLTKGGERRAKSYRDVAQRAIQQNVGDTGRSVDELRKLLAELPGRRELRLLLVLDTFERVQEVSFEFTVALWDFLNELAHVFPYVRIVVAGRAPLSDEIAHVPYPLQELDREAALGFLESKGVTNPGLANAIYQRVGGDPLSLRLVLEGLKQEHDDLSRLTALPDDFDELSLDHEVNQGWLYRRYLSRVRDPVVRRLAHPGLTLRRVTPALIRHVLAVPCRVDVPSDEAAEDLFDRLAQQASLVTRESRWVLRHRPDVRKRMLRALVQTEGMAVFEIHRLAVEFYAAEEVNPENRAEEIYHRLFISADGDEIDARWMPEVARHLRDAIEEVPPETRSYLIARLENTSAAFDWSEADALSKEKFAATRARDAMAVGDLAGAVKILAEIRDRLPGSELYRLEAQALERMGRFPEARITANEGLFAARKARDVELELDLLLVAIRANEVLGQVEQATALYRQLARLDVPLKPPDDELLAVEIMVHGLRLCRMDPSTCEDNGAGRPAETWQRLQPVWDTAARVNPALLLDAVQEIGAAQPEALVRLLAQHRATLSQQSCEARLAGLVQDWSAAVDGRPGATPAPLQTTARLLQAGKRDEALAAAGAKGPGAWVELLLWLLTSTAPTQALVAGLVELIRAGVSSAQAGGSTTSAWQQQTVAALVSAFASREELESFLRSAFPEEVSSLAAQSTYQAGLEDLAARFERQGRTEELVAAARAVQPDNPVLAALEQRLEAAAQATPDSSASPAINVNVSVGTNYGDIVGVQISSLNLAYSRSVPPETLEALPKVMPINASSATGPVWAPPELVFNWALGMRRAMRAVCRLDAHGGSSTGFLVGPSLLLVPLYAVELLEKDPRAVRASFDHMLSPTGTPGNPTAYLLAKDWLAARSKPLGHADKQELALALVRLEGTPGLDRVPGEQEVQRGWLSLSPAPAQAGQGVFMLHHPLGGPLMLEYGSVRTGSDGRLSMELVRGVRAPGAGGAPCCDEAWRVIAVRLGSDPDRREGFVVWTVDLLADEELFGTIYRHLPEEGRLERLIQALADTFDYDELAALAQSLGIDWASLAGSTRSEKARALAEHAAKENRQDRLVRQAMEHRPQVKWL